MTTQLYEIAAWLGDDWSDDQIQSITDEYLRLERKLDLDHEEGQALLTAIAQRVQGVTACVQAGPCSFCALDLDKEAKRARREVT